MQKGVAAPLKETKKATDKPRYPITNQCKPGFAKKIGTKRYTLNFGCFKQALARAHRREPGIICYRIPSLSAPNTKRSTELTLQQK